MRACLVLHSTNNDSLPNLGTFFNSLFSDSVVFSGSLFSDKFSSCVSNEVPSEAGVFAVSDSSLYEMPIPSRSSLIVSCFAGCLSNKDDIDAFTGLKDEKYSEDGFYPSKLVVRLNSSYHTDKVKEEGDSNYADCVKSRVLDKMAGVFAFTLAYITLSGRSRIIIGRSNRDIYFHLVYTSNFYALVWTDEVGVFSTMDSRFLVYSMTPLYQKDVLVIHPLFLIDKWKKWRQRHKTNNGNLMAVSLLEKYLERISR